MDRLLSVCVASGLGGGARYLISGWIATALGPSFPFGTLAVNVIGSLLLSVITYAGVEVAALPPTLRLALTVGVMGGFTTYSTFSYETMRYLQDGAWAIAAGNVLITVTACLGASFLGWTGARWLYSI